ncbi:hypothetical protein HDU87_003930 [Geranomyces variabilis]|uniref:Uncharacterized protein n=1 Tax=Geranomyces variabilis TaxID=109894 RepID=A0AAD5XVI4_9FUNG|nr:hypothetical protein HDU87_003930 [Geranomyces variabilis]
MSVEDLAKIVEWKLSRGIYRPTLLAQVKSNSAELVESTSKAAFSLLKQNKTLEALAEISKLKGVGPATASAILSAHSPDVPFMSDESLATFFPAHKLPYTASAYKTLLARLTERAAELNEDDAKSEWTAGKVERAIWAWNVIEKLTNVARKRPPSWDASSSSKKAKTE